MGTMAALGVHVLLLLSLPLTTLCRQYRVISQPSDHNTCIVLTVANGGNQADATNPGKIGCFDHGKKMCTWPDVDCETAEDRCDPDLSKERFTALMVNEISAQLKQRHGVSAASIIRQRVDTESGEDSLPGATPQEWLDFDAAINKTVNGVCYGRRGLTLDFIARDPDHCKDLISLGYLIPGKDIEVDTDDELNDELDVSSVRGLGFVEHIPLTRILRGPFSLGGCLTRVFNPDNNVKVVPSPGKPKPDKNSDKEPCYYKGGYTVRQYGSCCNALKMDAIQVAIPQVFMSGATNRQQNAAIIADGIHEFLRANHLL